MFSQGTRGTPERHAPQFLFSFAYSLILTCIASGAASGCRSAPFDAQPMVGQLHARRLTTARQESGFHSLENPCFGKNFLFP